MDDIAAMVDRHLGEGYFQPHPDPERRVIVRVEEDGALAAAAVGWVGSLDEVIACAPVANHLLQAACSADPWGAHTGPVLYVQVVVVDERMRGQGIGAMAMSQLQQRAAHRGASRALMLSWRRRAVQTGRFARQGFRMLTVIPDAWERDSIMRGYVCPDCGDPPCWCAAELRVCP